MYYQYAPGRIWAENEAGEVIAEITFPAKDISFCREFAFTEEIVYNMLSLE